MSLTHRIDFLVHSYFTPEYLQRAFRHYNLLRLVEVVWRCFPNLLRRWEIDTIYYIIESCHNIRKRWLHLLSFINIFCLSFFFLLCCKLHTLLISITLCYRSIWDIITFYLFMYFFCCTRCTTVDDGLFNIFSVSRQTWQSL